MTPLLAVTLAALTAVPIGASPDDAPLRVDLQPPTAGYKWPAWQGMPSRDVVKGGAVVTLALGAAATAVGLLTPETHSTCDGVNLPAPGDGYSAVGQTLNVLGGCPNNQVHDSTRDGALITGGVLLTAGLVMSLAVLLTSDAAWVPDTCEAGLKKSDAWVQADASERAGLLSACR